MHKPVSLLLIAVFAVAGCATTQEANKALKSRFIGQPSDAFFSQYGAPLTSFPLNNGGTVYRWRGGETMLTIPAKYETVTPANAAPGMGHTSTTTKISQPDANTTVTKTESSSWSIGAPAGSQQILLSPERRERLFCEAQITVDAKGVITNVEATRDTVGQGFSLSRCAEVFKVE